MSYAQSLQSVPAAQKSGPNQLITYFDERYQVSWAYMNARPRQCFSPALLGELLDWFHQSDRQIDDPARPDVQYMVTASAVPGIYNLGGDLALFQTLIRAQDRDSLRRYAEACIEPLYLNAVHLHRPGLRTISLVQGDALGGGFECALSANVLIAERGTKLGFPEILFNLFPGMGALSLLGRRIGLARAERVILSGRLYSAEEMYDLGAVDLLVEPGEGERAVYDHVRRESRMRNGVLALSAARDLVQSISRDELMGIAEVWVDAALRLEAKDLRMIERLVQRQNIRATPSSETLGAALTG